MQRLPTVAVVGAGLAGCATAHALAARGCKVHLIDPLGIAQATSGNRLGAVLPRVMRDDNLAARFTRAAFLRAVARVREFAPLDPDLCCLRGILHLAQDEDDEAVMQRSAQRHALDPDFAELVDVARASALAGVPVAHGGWWFPQGGWVAPARFCQALVNAHAERISTHWGVAVHALRQVHDGWQVCDAQGEVIVQADAVVLANAEDAVRFCPGLGPLQRVRGQLSEWPAMHMRAPDIPVTGDGYVMPARDGMVLVGATYELDDDPSPALRTDAHRLNAERVQRLLPSHPALHDGARMEVDVHADMPGRVGWRVVANDRLPLIGLVQRGQAESDKAESDKAGLYVVTGLASRGITWSVLAGEIVCAQLCGDPLPIERALLQAVAPTRFAERRARRGNAIMSP
jgi:tRNA 5-methylaminomethyl-2-thiouridine biosynthesis bifunctional protein